MLKNVIRGLGFLLLAAGILSAQEPADKAQKSKPPVQKPAPQTAGPQEPARPMISRGKLFVQQPSWDFGHVSQDAQVTHRFILENVGDDTLFIEKIKPT